MAYRAQFSKSARRQLRRLPEEIVLRIRRRIEQLKEAPRGYGSKQLQGRPIRWSSRIGDLRIVYRIDDHGEKIHIQAVGNRDNIYDIVRRLR